MTVDSCVCVHVILCHESAKGTNLKIIKTPDGFRWLDKDQGRLVDAGNFKITFGGVFKNTAVYTESRFSNTQIY